MNTVLRCDNLTKKFGFNEVLSNIFLNVKRGDKICIIGKSGAGKTLLLNIIASVVYQTNGKIFINGMDKDGVHSSRIRSCVAMLANDDMLDSNISVVKNLELKGRLYNQSYAELDNRIQYYLQLFELEKYAETAYGKLTKEKRKRVDFIRVLLVNPKLLLIDDGYAIIERDILSKVFNHINKLRNKNKITVIMVTNYFLDVDKSDNIVYMHSGKIRANNSLRNLLNENLNDKLILHEPNSQDYNEYLKYTHQSYIYENHAYYINIPIDSQAVAILNDLKIKYGKYEFLRAGLLELYNYFNAIYDKEYSIYIENLMQINGN